MNAPEPLGNGLYGYKGNLKPLWGTTEVEVSSDCYETTTLLQLAAGRTSLNDSTTALSIQLPWAMLMDEYQLSVVVCRQHFNYPGLDISYFAEKAKPASPHGHYRHIPVQDDRTRLRLNYENDWVNMQVPMAALKKGQVLMASFHPVPLNKSMAVGTFLDRTSDNPLIAYDEDNLELAFCGMDCDVPNVVVLPVHRPHKHTAEVVELPFGKGR